MFYTANDIKAIDELLDMIDDISFGTKMNSDRKSLYPIYVENGIRHIEFAERIYQVFAKRYENYFENKTLCKECFHLIFNFIRYAKYYYNPTIFNGFASRIYTCIIHNEDMAWTKAVIKCFYDLYYAEPHWVQLTSSKKEEIDLTPLKELISFAYDTKE